MSENIQLPSFLMEPLAQSDPEMYELIRKRKTTTGNFQKC